MSERKAEVECSSEQVVLSGYDIPGEQSIVAWLHAKEVEYDPDTMHQMRKRFNYSMDALDGKRVLVVGAGTLGNEVVKNLVLSGVSDLTIVDHDVYEPWNLPRSTLVSMDDLGENKAHALARRAMEKSPFPIACTGIGCDISRLGYGFFEGFDVITSPVDSWSVRSYVDRGCVLMGKPHITGGTGTSAHMGGMMTGQVLINHTGSEACYECMNRGNLSDQEAKLSCSNLPPDTQPQVMAYSSAVAGYISQAILHTLMDAEYPFTRSGRSEGLLAYHINEIGFGDAPLGVRSRMPEPDHRGCSFHRLIGKTVNKEPMTIFADRSDDVRTLWRKVSDATGVEDVIFDLDFIQDRVYYLAFPEGDVRDPERKTPVSSLELADTDEAPSERMAIERMPRDHIYHIRDAFDESRCWRIRLVFGG